MPGRRRILAPPAAEQAAVDTPNIQPPRLEVLPDRKESFEDLTRKHIELLRTLANVARATLETHLSDENFKRVVKFAYDQKVVTADKLGEIGRVDRTTASRWINGQTAPGALAQETILAKIADEASNRARALMSASK